MPTRPKFFLLDAGPIIELHRLGLWGQVLERADVIVPRVIGERETQYWRREDGRPVAIDLWADEQAERLVLLDCEESELRTTLELYDVTMQQSIDPGELHALTLLRTWTDDSPPHFCTADRKATEALCLLGRSELAISLEEVLITVGMTRSLDRRFTGECLEQWITVGRRRFLQRDGLATHR